MIFMMMIVMMNYDDENCDYDHCDDDDNDYDHCDDDDDDNAIGEERKSIEII
jgi:hypothetical protein